MAETNHLNTVRGKALDRIDKSHRNYKLAFITAAVLETLFVVGFLLLADLHNRTHVLLLIATMATYMILVAALFALGAHVSRNTQTVLKAVELLEKQIEESRR
ncbi:MAG: hypothetical protein M3X11_18545 [Acidobacteriota bacterium]|nr:hypothetical protein [Acidobacteriota bacterium]